MARRAAAIGLGMFAGPALAALLAGCAGDPPKSFDLGAGTPAPARGLRAGLVIREPSATLDLDGTGMLVRQADRSVATLAGAQWADRLPALVQVRLAQTFENAGMAAQVSRDAAAPGAYALETDLRSFELDAGAKAVRIDVAVKLVARQSGRVAATKIFSAQAPVASTQGPDVAAAFDKALRGLMVEIVKFAVNRG